MKAANELYIVEGGDHSLQVSKSRLTASAETQNDIDERILEAVRNFVGAKVSRKDGLEDWKDGRMEES
jgi:hypothetical protein